LIKTATIGASATIAHDFFIAPSDMIKQRLQLKPELSAIECVKTIVRDEGFLALYRSYPVTVLMNIPFMTTVVCVNENMRTWVRPWDRAYPILWYFLCAGAAGATAAVVTNPLDVIKTRLQT
jgi:solute carrier family 25 iron transporter 28/37